MPSSHKFFNKDFFNEKLKGLKIYFDDNLPFPTVLKQLFLVQILNRDSVVIEKNWVRKLTFLVHI